MRFLSAIYAICNRMSPPAGRPVFVGRSIQVKQTSTSMIVQKLYPLRCAPIIMIMAIFVEFINFFLLGQALCHFIPCIIHKNNEPLMNSSDVGNQSRERLHSFPKATQWVNARAELTNPGNGNPPVVPAPNCVKSNCGKSGVWKHEEWWKYSLRKQAGKCGVAWDSITPPFFLACLRP